jgi:hypothetical protein
LRRLFIYAGLRIPVKTATKNAGKPATHSGETGHYHPWLVSFLNEEKNPSYASAVGKIDRRIRPMKPVCFHTCWLHLGVATSGSYAHGMRKK